MTGNPGKRPLNRAEPQPELEAPSCPDHLNDEARIEWERVVPELLNLGLLTRVDRAALAAYCQAWARWVEAENAIRKHGVIIRSPNNYPIQSPFLAIANKAMEQMRRFLVEFGLSPSSRTRVSPSDGESEDPAAEYF